MANYGYQSNQYYDDDDGESISSGSNDNIHRTNPGAGGGNMPYQYSTDTGEIIDNDGNNGISTINNTSPTYLGGTTEQQNIVDFDDPRIASLPRILLMGPRRAGKTSIQRVVFHKMSPHETLFRLEATQMLERAVVDHTPLCRFTIWDFPGDQYEYGYDDQ